MSQASAAKSTQTAPPPVNPRPQVFLFVAVVLFLGWTAFMTYLALTTVNPIVVSQPQIYVAPIVVEARVPDGAGSSRTVTVTHVYRGQRHLSLLDQQKQPDDLKIEVNNLGEARGWRGAGDYILALQPYQGAFDLVATPMSPGFPPKNHPERLHPAIYPATESTRAQTEKALQLSEGGR